MSQANNGGKNVPDTGNSKSNTLRQEETGHVLKMVKKGDFPGGPVVMAQGFHIVGPGFNP